VKNRSLHACQRLITRQKPQISEYTQQLYVLLSNVTFFWYLLLWSNVAVNKPINFGFVHKFSCALQTWRITHCSQPAGNYPNFDNGAFRFGYWTRKRGCRTRLLWLVGLLEFSHLSPPHTDVNNSFRLSWELKTLFSCLFPQEEQRTSRQNLPGEMLWSRCLVPKVWRFGTPHPSPYSVL